MIFFFGHEQQTIFAVSSHKDLDTFTTEKLTWLFGNQPKIDLEQIDGKFVGPRAAMVTPWSTNAVEITQNMGITGIERIEQYFALNQDDKIDPMLSQEFNGLNQHIFKLDITPETPPPPAPPTPP
ncbi:MAG TPA: hypothetical protein DCZ44_02185, partial [Flavobacteriaceae bacterium]|nr:hypothetical protein [Flavobacteriaceae bacterium]